MNNLYEYLGRIEFSIAQLEKNLNYLLSEKLSTIEKIKQDTENENERMDIERRFDQSFESEKES
jgi:hypothetical protein